MISDSFFENLDDMDSKNIVAICEKFITYSGKLPQEDKNSRFEEHIHAYAALKEYLKTYNIEIDKPLNFGVDRASNI